MNLAYDDLGKGPTLVLLHGFCENKELWNSIQGKLSLYFRVISIDLPGHGLSKQESDELSMEYQADKVKELLDAIGVSQCILIGHSLGGYVTLAFAEKYAGQLQGFGLFHSTAFEDTEEKRRNRDRTIEFIEKHGMDTFADSFVTPLFYPKNRDKLSVEIEFVKNVCRQTDISAVIATTKAMRDRNDRIHVLKETQLPVLFIIGKEDNAVPFEKSMEQCHLPKKHSICILEETGHMGMLEKEEESLKCIKEFVEEVNG
jgi:pimeloyl-ACP methyl ester carboxylesterase